MKWFKKHKKIIKWCIFFLKCILLLPAVYSTFFILISEAFFSNIFQIFAPCIVSLAVSLVDCLEKSFYQKINKYISVFLLDVILLLVSIIPVSEIPIYLFYH